MYSIRLELGREAEDRRFYEYQRELEKREILEEKALRKRKKLIRKITNLCMHLIVIIICIIFAVLDINKFKEYQAVLDEIARQPVITEAHPTIDTSLREELERIAQEEEERKSKMYSADEAEEMVTLGDDILSEFAIVVDANENKIISSRKGKTIINPASMTKILTVLVAAENIEENQLDDTFTVTEDINYYSYKNGCSAVGFSDNEVVTVRDLFYGTILPSGGDAALSLATYIAGSQEAFVDMMNEKLEVLGLSETAHFTNCIGLYDENHYCTCYDMAMILHAAIDNPICKEVLSTRIYTTSKTEQHPDGIEISNWFLRRIEDKPCGGDVICAKTGYVNQSGNCSASYASDGNGHDYICVTGNAPGSWKCIYDHVRTYRQIFPSYDESAVNAEQEEKEYAGEVQDH